MTRTQQKTVIIAGMHCASCEVLIERRFGRLPGVTAVSCDFTTGKTVLRGMRLPTDQEIIAALPAGPYRLANTSRPEYHRDWSELVAVVGLVLIGYYFVAELHLFPSLGVSSSMSLGFVFAIGLVAAMSTCMAVTGGLLVSVAASYNRLNPDFTGWQRLKPHLYFNLGRIVSYTILGGGVGLAGSILTLSPAATGVMTVFASVVMVLLGFQMLELFPAAQKIQLRMPKRIGHYIHAHSQSRVAPFTLGALTFFMPCGFTQALQLYVLSKGSWQTGALTMLVFSLGTLPALMSLGAIASFVNGAFQRYFIQVAAVVVILVGVVNIQNGVAIAGIWRRPASIPVSLAPIENGRQIVTMKLVGFQYEPRRVTVRQGVPVEWRLDGRGAEGCAQVVMMPKMKITESLPRDQVKTITFTPTELGEMPFSCPMGMTSREAAFIVVPNT